MNKQNSDWETEELSKQFHAVYMAEARRQGDVRHADAYEDLAENVKEFDRVLARHVIALLETEREKILELMERRTGLMRYSSFRGLLEEVQALRPASKDITQISEKSTLNK